MFWFQIHKLLFRSFLCSFIHSLIFSPVQSISSYCGESWLWTRKTSDECGHPGYTILIETSDWIILDVLCGETQENIIPTSKLNEPSFSYFWFIKLKINYYIIGALYLQTKTNQNIRFSRDSENKRTLVIFFKKVRIIWISNVCLCVCMCVLVA